MTNPTFDALRYVRGWVRNASPPPFRGVFTQDIEIRSGGDEAIQARRYRPASRSRRPLPGWVMLHGATRPGPDHGAIVRFAAALASAGGDVLVPDVRAWRSLDLDPAPARRALALAARHHCADAGVRPGGVVLVGLSFGCPQAIIAAPELAAEGLVRGVLGYGGYHSLENTVRFALTGQFEWRERIEHLRPDPYGRWVIAANYLHRIPGYEGAEDVSRALGRLAALAGDHGFMAWEPSSDPYKAEVVKSVSAPNRELFRFFAPDSAQDPDPRRAEELAPVLVEAARATHPELELPRVPDGRSLPPIRLIHGRQDHLIPFTETLALERHLRKRADVDATVTDLLAHSRGSGASIARLREAMRFFAAIRGALALHAG